MPPEMADSGGMLSNGRFDVVIIGGGVSGLWCRWRIAQAGYSVALLESNSLGSGQTGASQGILHRGVKYALSAQAAHAAAVAEESARAWDDAMTGRAGPDLSGVRVLADRMLMWTDAGLLSKLTGAIASKVLTSHVVPAEPKEIPSFLAQRGRSVYRVGETVIDPISVVRSLAQSARGPLIRTGVRAIASTQDQSVVSTESGELRAGALVLCAGEGNAGLLEMLGQRPDDWMQRRDLHMVAAAGAPGPLFGHWVASATDKPRLSVTSAITGSVVHWYLGGELAESGVVRPQEDQIAAAKSELEICFPGLNPESWSFRAIRISRAEGKTDAGKRPDAPVVREIGGTGAIAVWPTKLVMAPAAADDVCRLIQARLRPVPGNEWIPGSEARPDYAIPAWQIRE